MDQRDVERVVVRVAASWPRGPEPPSDLVEACDRLGWPDAAELVAAGEVVGAVALIGAGAVAAVISPGLLPLALVAGITPLLATRQVPPAMAAVATTRAVGEAPALFGRLTLRLRIEPNLERAVEFAGGGDTLAGSLQAHARRSRGTPDAGFQSFAAEWGDRAPSIERAAALVVDAAEAPAEARERACERALETVRAGVEERAAAFAGDVRPALTGLYAFGVLLPLALVGVLPAARLAGVRLGVSTLAVLYDVILPGGLITASGWLLARRPVSFPPAPVDSTHPDVPDRRLAASLLGAATGTLAGVVCLVVLPWAAPVGALGVGGGVALVWLFAPARELRRELRAVESGIPDALSLVGRRVADGVAVERALEEVADELPGPAGELIEEAVGRLERLGLPVEGGFFGRFGALHDVPSPRARYAGRLFGVAATEGEPAGDALIAAGEHLRELARVERDARRELASITGTLSNTAALFGPLVGGVSVAMVGRLPDAGRSVRGTAAGTATATGTTPASGEAALDIAAIGPVVGLYVLLLAAILTGLATALERGLDRSLIGYRVGIALPTATAAYVAAVVAAGTLL
ncbi:type II secretion system F family protein [Halolamina litorea]|uniref:Type II secretion system F family protein n=1 Tax=Halolamina litorea TaxID=1515593 RepID=A0ABD6BPH5_9EURY|nr:type II secretion system protein [Halolamina litorea]